MRKGRAHHLGILAVALALTACSTKSPSGHPADPRRTASQVDTSSALRCEGSGAPTIVLEPGLDTGGSTFTLLALRLARHHRVCSHTRPGIEDRPPADGLASSAQGAADLASTLEHAGETPPYVVVGWSYGGVVAQAFANAHSDQVAGMVLEDSSDPAQLGDPAFGLPELTDGGRPVDLDASAASLRGLSLGDVPLIVLSSDELSGSLRTKWYAFHRAQADLSSQGQHVRAVGSGHAIHADAAGLEAAAITLVTTAARTGAPLPPCGETLTRHHARCLD